MALTEVEERLLDSFVWLRNIHHEVQHQKQVEIGPERVDPRLCEARSCKHANEVIEWCKAKAAQP